MFVWLSVGIVALAALAALAFAARRRGRSDAGATAAPSSVPRIRYDEEEDGDVTQLSKFAERTERDRVEISGQVVPEEIAEDHVIRATVSAALRTNRGASRARNEDSVAALSELGLFVVADGVGGQAAGERASRLAVERLEEHVSSGVDGGELDGASSLPRDALLFARAVCAANRAVFEEGQRDPSARGMCTTLTALRFSELGQRAYVMHVGDSRCYRVRGGTVELLTKDHLRDGKLTRAIGLGAHVAVDVVITSVQLHDTFVLCSDGVAKFLRDEDLSAAITEESPKKAARILGELAQSRGAADDLSVLVVNVQALVIGVPDGARFGVGGLGLQ